MPSSNDLYELAKRRVSEHLKFLAYVLNISLHLILHGNILHW